MLDPRVTHRFPILITDRESIFIFMLISLCRFGPRLRIRVTCLIPSVLLLIVPTWVYFLALGILDIFFFILIVFIVIPLVFIVCVVLILSILIVVMMMTAPVEAARAVLVIAFLAFIAEMPEVIIWPWGWLVLLRLLIFESWVLVSVH